MLGENQVVIDPHIKNAAFVFDQLRINIESILQLGRQTGGLRKIVSDAAIID